MQQKTKTIGDGRAQATQEASDEWFGGSAEQSWRPQVDVLLIVQFRLWGLLQLLHSGWLLETENQIWMLATHGEPKAEFGQASNCRLGAEIVQTNNWEPDRSGSSFVVLGNRVFVELGSRE